MAESAAQGVGKQFLDNLVELNAARIVNLQQGRTIAASGAVNPELVNFFVIPEPANAMIRIDGLTRARHRDFLYRVPPGRHQLTVSAPNYRTVQTTVEVENNTVLNIPLALSDGGQEYVERAASLQVFKDRSEAQIHIAKHMAGAVVNVIPDMVDVAPAFVDDIVISANAPLSTPKLDSKEEESSAEAAEQPDSGKRGTFERLMGTLFD